VVKFLAVGEQEVGFVTDDHAHQAIEGVVGIVVVANQLVGDGLKQLWAAAGSTTGNDSTTVKHKFVLVRNRKWALRLADVIAQLKRHVAPIGDVGHASDQEAT